MTTLVIKIWACLHMDAWFTYPAINVSFNDSKNHQLSRIDATKADYEATKSGLVGSEIWHKIENHSETIPLSLVAKIYHELGDQKYWNTLYSIDLVTGERKDETGMLYLRMGMLGQWILNNTKALGIEIREGREHAYYWTEPITLK